MPLVPIDPLADVSMRPLVASDRPNWIDDLDAVEDAIDAVEDTLAVIAAWAELLVAAQRHADPFVRYPIVPFAIPLALGAVDGLLTQVSGAPLSEAGSALLRRQMAHHLGELFGVSLPPTSGRGRAKQGAVQPLRVSPGPSRQPRNSLGLFAPEGDA